MHAKATNRGAFNDAGWISQQRAQALAKANHVRQRRASLKHDLKTGDESLAVLVLDPPDYLDTAPVEALVMATPGLGKVKAHALLREVGIRPKTTIGRLTDRQRMLLAAGLTRH